jgi:RNA polymerase sigma-70 factor (ECF subfamily)
MSVPWGKYSDIELFEMIKRKDNLSERAFSELYHRYSDRIFSYCYKILGDYQDAKDIFQETFVKFYQNIDTYSLSGTVSGLLFTIARNYSLNYNRKNKLFSELSEDLFVESESEQENKETMDMITRALDLIPFHQKEAFILRHYQGLSYDEISKITLTDAATIRTRVKRAIVSLQRILRPFFDEDDNNGNQTKNKKKVLNYKFEKN